MQRESVSRASSHIDLAFATTWTKVSTATITPSITTADPMELVWAADMVCPEPRGGAITATTMRNHAIEIAGTSTSHIRAVPQLADHFPARSSCNSDGIRRRVKSSSSRPGLRRTTSGKPKIMIATANRTRATTGANLVSKRAAARMPMPIGIKTVRFTRKAHNADSIHQKKARSGPKSGLPPPSAGTLESVRARNAPWTTTAATREIGYPRTQTTRIAAEACVSANLSGLMVGRASNAPAASSPSWQTTCRIRRTTARYPIGQAGM